VREVIRRYIVYSLPSAPAVFYSFNSIKDKDIFSSYPARIKALSVTFLVSTFNPVRAVDRFSAVLSAFTKSLI